MKVLRITLTVIAALFLSLIGLSLLFSDLGPEETIASRILTIVILYFISAVIIGFVNPHQWLLALLVSWESILLGLIGLISADSRLEAGGLILIALIPVLLGGILGSWISRERIIQRFYSRIRNRP